MKRAREDSLDNFMENWSRWYSGDGYITEEDGYMVTHRTHLDLSTITSFRDDGWLYCGKVEDGIYGNHLFTWEGK